MELTAIELTSSQQLVALPGREIAKIAGSIPVALIISFLALLHVQ